MKFFCVIGSYLLLCITLSGCSLEFPAVQSAAYTEYVKGSPSKPVVLTTTRAQRLAGWLASRRSGWSPSFVSYVPNVLIQIKHVDGSVSRLNLYPRKAIADGSFGSHERELTEPEVLEIKGLLGLNGS
jgi:hypothetical protein